MKVTGIISSATALHNNYSFYFSRTVTGTSYLTSLTIEDARIVAPEGKTVEMTVNGKATEIESGKTYTGDIVLSIS